MSTAAVPARGRALTAVALGGALGSLARWALGEALAPHETATLTANILGCAALGALVTWLTARHPHHPWLRPLLGTGVLGGFTTFSAATAHAHAFLLSGRWPMAVAYSLGTLTAALLATWAGAAGSRALLGKTPRRGDLPGVGGHQGGSTDSSPAGTSSGGNALGETPPDGNTPMGDTPRWGARSGDTSRWRR